MVASPRVVMVLDVDSCGRNIFNLLSIDLDWSLNTSGLHLPIDTVVSSERLVVHESELLA